MDLSSYHKQLILGSNLLIPMIKVSVQDVDRYVYHSLDHIFTSKLYYKLLRMEYTNGMKIIDKQILGQIELDRIFESVDNIVKAILLSHNEKFANCDFMRLVKTIKKIINRSNLNHLARSDIYNNLNKNYINLEHSLDDSWIEESDNRLLVRYLIDSYLILLPS